MTESPLGHDLHATLHRVVRRHAGGGRSHDVAHRGVMRRAVFQDYLPGVIALGNDADQGSLIHDQQRTHMPRRHDLDGVQNGILRHDGENLGAFYFEQLTHGLHNPPLVLSAAAAAMTILPPNLRTSIANSMTDADFKPPVAAIRLHAVMSPYGARIDPYYWLRDDERTNPEVLAYLAEENAYRARCMATSQPCENALYEEIVARLKQDDASVPYRKHGYWYNTRFEPGKEHPIFARRKGSLEAPEEILLNANALAAGHDYYRIGAFEVSPNCMWLAFCEDTVGRRQYALRFNNFATGEILSAAIPQDECDIAWASDNRSILYVEKDPETLLGLYVKKHVLGADPRDDIVVFEQTDLSFYTGVSKSKSERFIFIHMESTVASEWRYAHADDPALEFRTVLPHDPDHDHEYQVEHQGDGFIIRTNWQARNFRLMRVPIGKEADRADWQDVVAHRDDTVIEDFDVFNGFLALSVRTGGLARISIVLNVADPSMPGSESAQARAEFFIASDEAAYGMALSVNPELDTELLRYTYSSLTTPTTVYDFNRRPGEEILLKMDPVVGSFDPENYRSHFLFA